jgi:potassium-dependent mechanosensitive channel
LAATFISTVAAIVINGDCFCRLLLPSQEVPIIIGEARRSDRAESVGNFRRNFHSKQRSMMNSIWTFGARHSSSEGLRVVRLLVLASFTLTVLAAGATIHARQVPTPTATSQASPTPTPASDAIPPTQLLSRAESLSRNLHDIATRLALNEDLGALSQALAQSEEDVFTKSGETLAAIEGGNASAEIRAFGQYWLRLLETNVARQSDLSNRAATINQDIATLNTERTQWRATLAERPQADPELAAIELARESLPQIDTLQARATGQLRQIAELQQRVRAEDAVATDLLDRVNRQRREAQRQLLQRDSLPLWKFKQRREPGESSENDIRSLITNYPKFGSRFFRDRSSILVAMIVFFLLLLACSTALRRTLGESRELSISQSQLLEMVKHPIALSVLGALTFGIIFGFWVPVWLLGLLGVALVIPVLRFLPGLIAPYWRPLLYLLAISFVITVVRFTAAPTLPLTRDLDALFDFAVIAIFLRITLRQSFREAVRTGFWPRLIIRVSRLGIALLAVALIANVAGFARLAQVVSRSTTYSAFLAVILFMSVRGAILSMSVILRTERASVLVTVRTRKSVILTWAERILATLAVLFWMSVTASSFMIRDQLSEAIVSVLTWRITFGTLSFSIGSVLTVVLVLLIGLGFSSAVKFVLREEVLSRFRLSRGLPDLITTLFYYGLIIIVVVLAFGAAGVEFSRLTVLTGALGVGIGFGLQNIVNNFVSGLILQFERDIHVGDIVEVGGMSGEVRRIGVRASTVQTGQGAEVIVPNADLVAGRVVNWTLSSERRRIDFPVAVAHGNDPRRVIDVLMRTALANSGVMTDPAPKVLFQGMTENALLFELRFWAPDRASYIELQSEVGLAVTESLRAEGIEIPQDRMMKMIEAVKDHAGAAVPDQTPGDRNSR